MKKLLSILLILVLAMGTLAGCGGNAGGEKTEGSADAQLKVGFVFIGAINDNGYTQAQYEGMKAAEDHFAGKIKCIYQENVSDTDKQASLDAATNLIDQGCNVIVGGSYGFMDSLDELANSGDYDDVNFLHFSGNKMNDKNFGNFFGSMEESRYLCGMIAGSMTKSNLLGYVAAYPYTEVQIGINAFTLGAQSVNPDVQVKIVYINSWGDPEAELAAAEQLLGVGCDVITQHSDSTGPQIAAQDAGAYAIGYNYDYAAAPESYLTAAVWNYGAYLIPTFQAMMDGTWKPESYYGTMADGFVDIGKMTDLVPQDVQDLVNAKKQEMIDGKFAPFSGKILYADGTELCKEGQTLTREEIWSINQVVKGAN